MSVMLNTLSDDKLADLLRGGGVGVLPTDTVYGVVCVASHELGVRRLYKLKSRDKKPGTIIAANIDQLIDLGLKARYLKAVEEYWPGPVGVVIPCVQLQYLHQGVGSLVVRISDNQQLNYLLLTTGPLLSSSANQPGQPVANTIQEAQDYFGDTVDFYVDGGDLSGQKPSTLIRIVDDAVEVLRDGAVKIDEETGRITH